MFASAPGFEVLGEAADGATAVRLAQELRPDVILMDLRMPGMDGLTAINELTRLGVTARVLVLTTYDTDTHALPAIEARLRLHGPPRSAPGRSRMDGRTRPRIQSAAPGGRTAIRKSSIAGVNQPRTRTRLGTKMSEREYHLAPGGLDHYGLLVDRAWPWRDHREHARRLDNWMAVRDRRAAQSDAAAGRPSRGRA
nr:response regulator transcription factor [Nonomuraea sp. SYSU D8015]